MDEENLLVPNLQDGEEEKSEFSLRPKKPKKNILGKIKLKKT